MTDKTTYISVTSDGTESKFVAAELTATGCNIGFGVEAFMSAPGFTATKGVTYTLGIVRGDEFEDGEERTSKNIRDKAYCHGWKDSTPDEVAYLLRKAVIVEKLNLWWLVVMTESGKAFVLTRDDCGRWFALEEDAPTRPWNRADGFAFLVETKVSAETKNPFDVFFAG